MNKDAVRVNQIDLPTVFPSMRLLEALRVGWSIPCLFAAAVVFAGFQMDFGTSFKDGPLDVTTAVSPIVPMTIAKGIHSVEVCVVHGSNSGLIEFVLLFIRMAFFAFGAVAIARCTVQVVNRNERSGVIRLFQYCGKSWKPIVISTLLAAAIGLLGLFCFRVVGRMVLWSSGSSGEVSVPNIFFWLCSFVYLIGLYILMAGWLLGLSAIAIDGVDGAEALSRGISYVLSRFRRTTCFLIIIHLIAKLSGHVTWWSVTLSGKLAFRSISESPQTQPHFSAGFDSFRFFIVECIHLSSVCCGLAIAYLILRQLIDNVDMREISVGK